MAIIEAPESAPLALPSGGMIAPGRALGVFSRPGQSKGWRSWITSVAHKRVGVMYGGKLLEVADARTLLTAPTHPYTRALIASRPAGAPRGKRLPVIPPEWSVEGLREAELSREGAAHG